jgi:hypothetical protein
MVRSAFMGVVTFVFGISLCLYGCTTAQKQQAEKTLDKIVAPVAAIAAGTAAVNNSLPPGSPVQSYTNLIIAVAGAILAGEKLVVGGIKMLPTKPESEPGK